LVTCQRAVTYIHQKQYKRKEEEEEKENNFFSNYAEAIEECKNLPFEAFSLVSVSPSLLILLFLPIELCFFPSRSKTIFVYYSGNV